jgi:hypothetical protein
LVVDPSRLADDVKDASPRKTGTINGRILMPDRAVDSLIKAKAERV